jgi:hypothetical protein
MKFVLERAAREHIEVRWPVLAAGVDPFEGIDAGARPGSNP